MDYDIEISRIKLLLENHGGVIKAGELNSAGIDRLKLYALLSMGILKKEFHGNYVFTDDQPDEYVLIQSRSAKLIYSHATALFLHGMSDRVPHILDITVPQGDNISRIRKMYQNTRFHYCKKDKWDLGIIEAKTPEGYMVKTYDQERCICDIVRDKDSVDMQIYTQVLKGYFSGKCNAGKLIRYAREFSIEAKIRNYMEVLQ